jgi:hypothetical protein
MKIYAFGSKALQQKDVLGFFPKFRSLFSLKIKVNAVANMCISSLYIIHYKYGSDKCKCLIGLTNQSLQRVSMLNNSS